MIPGKPIPVNPLLALWTRNYNLIWLHHRVSNEIRVLRPVRGLCLCNFKLRKTKRKAMANTGPGALLEGKAGERNEWTKETVPLGRRWWGVCKRSWQKSWILLGLKITIWPNPKQAEFCRFLRKGEFLNQWAGHCGKCHYCYSCVCDIGILSQSPLQEFKASGCDFQNWGNSRSAFCRSPMPHVSNAFT